MTDAGTSTRSGLLPYFLGTFSICWLCLGTVVLSERRMLSPGSPLLNLGLKGLGNFSPTLLAIGVTAYLLGGRRVLSTLARGLRGQAGAAWYMMALFLPFMMVGAGVELAVLLSKATSPAWTIPPPTLVGLLGVVVAPLGE